MAMGVGFPIDTFYLLLYISISTHIVSVGQPLQWQFLTRRNVGKSRSELLNSTINEDEQL